MSLQQLFLPQFLYAAGFVGIAVSFLHSGASRVLLVQVVPFVEYLRRAGTFLLVLFKRFCFFPSSRERGSPLSQGELAKIAGASQAQMERCVQILKKEEVLATSRKQLAILDEKKLLAHCTPGLRENL